MQLLELYIGGGMSDKKIIAKKSALIMIKSCLEKDKFFKC